ncbi:glycosyltransferase family 61 protein [Bacillus timonensis]|uniref:glycosyltransferase family 61 protein n=1 Tax=Bacillus timonensis TaxID=1033734 RepID=UPI0002E2E945|nr:glycosyltransferase family 61 protein [Bacillus timonensis]
MKEQEFPIPDGTYLSLKDWYKTNYEFDMPLKVIEVKVPLPNVLVFEPNPRKKPMWSDELYIGEIPNGRVYGEQGIVISQDNKLLWDVSFEWFKEPNEHSVFKLDFLPEPSYLDETVAALTHIDSNNYYHWMFEVLPRIQALKAMDIKIDRYIFNHSFLPYQLETLSKLGINFEDIIHAKEGAHIQAKKLVVVSIPEFASDWACEFLRDNLLPKNNWAPKKEYERIYISRKGSRSIVNEDEILEALKDYKFKTIRLEEFRVSKQIEIFHSASVIISPHGAGLTNLAFCRPGTKVLEIYPESYINPIYWLICQFVNAEHHYYIGKGVKPEGNYYKKFNNKDNISINTSELVQEVENLLDS